METRMKCPIRNYNDTLGLNYVWKTNTTFPRVSNMVRYTRKRAALRDVATAEPNGNKDNGNSIRVAFRLRARQFVRLAFKISLATVRNYTGQT
jgi:hypothetical protein